MNQDDMNIILEELAKQKNPIDRNNLQVLTGITDTENFNSDLSYLEKNGKIVIQRKKIGLPEIMGFVPATIVRAAKGFLFAQPQAEEMEDVFIHSSVSKGAMPGDFVLLGNIYQEEKGPAGEVYKILQSGSHIITGMVSRNMNQFYVYPDSGFSYSVPVIRGGELKSKIGDKVKASVIYDQYERRIYARIIYIYGSASSAKICADAIIDSNNIPVKFSVPVKHEAAIKAAEPITDEEIAKRLDLRDEIIFTIDGKDAKDLDDAISVKKLEKGWELGVHIADVSHYVTMGSKLDEAAMDRATSVYFADRVIPMLPVEISNGCCSLNAGTKKLAFSAIMQLDENADLVNYKFAKSVIISKVRGVYSEVNEILDGTADESLKEKYAPVYDMIFAAKELADILKRKAKQRGGLEIETNELKFVLDEAGVCIDVSQRQRGEAEELIEQFMVMANSTAALYAKRAGVPFVYRVHENPDPERIETLSGLAAACGFDNRKIKAGLSQIDLAELINAAKETKYSLLISTQVLRSMAKAKYFTKPLGHYGLSLADYCHFTSPIRRYPDTSIHRILTDLVSGVPIDTIKQRYTAFVSESAKISSDREVRAMRAERDTERCYAAEYMTAHVGEIHKGAVSGVTNKGIFVTIENGIEGFVNLIRDERAYFEYDGETTIKDRISGVSYSIGDIVEIKVFAASVAMGTVDFELNK